MDELNKDTYSRISVAFVPDRALQHDVTVLLSMTPHGCVRLTAQCMTFVAMSGRMKQNALPRIPVPTDERFFHYQCI